MSLKNKELLKGYKTQLTKLEAEVSLSKQELGAKQKQHQVKINELNNLKKKIDSIESDKGITVSEHAILRYMERIQKIDIKAIEKEIISDEVLKMIETLGNTGSYPNKDFKLVIKNGTVVTIEN